MDNDFVIEEVNQNKKAVLRNAGEIARLMKLMFIAQIISVVNAVLVNIYGDFLSFVVTFAVSAIEIYYLYSLSKLYEDFDKLFKYYLVAFILANLLSLIPSNNFAIALIALVVGIFKIYVDVQILQTTAEMCGQVDEELRVMWEKIKSLYILGLGGTAILTFLTALAAGSVLAVFLAIGVLVVSIVTIVALIKEIIAYNTSSKRLENIAYEQEND